MSFLSGSQQLLGAPGLGAGRRSALPAGPERLGGHVAGPMGPGALGVPAELRRRGMSVMSRRCWMGFPRVNHPYYHMNMVDVW